MCTWLHVYLRSCRDLNSPFWWALHWNVARIPQDFIHSPSPLSFLSWIMLPNSHLLCIRHSSLESCCGHSACQSNIWSGQIRNWIWQFLIEFSADMNRHVLMWSAKQFSSRVGVLKKSAAPPPPNQPTPHQIFSLSSVVLFLVQTFHILTF